MRLHRDLRTLALPFMLCAAVLAGIFLSHEPLQAQQVGSVFCSQSAFFDGAPGTTKLVDGGGSPIYICGYDVSSDIAGRIQLKTGTPGNNCVTPTGNVTPNWNIAAGASNFGNANFVGIGPVARATDICVTTATSGNSQIHLYYARQ